MSSQVLSPSGVWDKLAFLVPSAGRCRADVPNESSVALSNAVTSGAGCPAASSFDLPAASDVDFWLPWFPSYQMG